MAKFDELYNEFEEACDRLDEGAVSEKDLDALKGVIDRLKVSGGKDADKKAILLAYAYSHLGNGYYSLADHEIDNGSREEVQKHFADAKGCFDKSLDLFDAINKNGDRDYLLADCYQMYAGFIEGVCCDEEKYGLSISEEDIAVFYKKSIDLYEELLESNEYDTREALMDVYFNAGGYYYAAGCTDKAVPLFKRSKSLADELDKEDPGAFEDFYEIIDTYLKED